MEALETYQRIETVKAIQYTGTAENIRAVEANFGRADSVWEGACAVAGIVVAVGDWMVLAEDRRLQVYSSAAFQARFRKAAPITTTGGAR